MKNLINIQSKVKQKVDENSITHNPIIIAVSKTFDLSHITPLINHGHLKVNGKKVNIGKIILKIK